MLIKIYDIFQLFARAYRMFLINNIVDYYEDSVPFDSPPSYRGLAIKYCYKVTVGAGRLQSSTKLLRLPVRILVLEGKLRSQLLFNLI